MDQRPKPPDRVVIAGGGLAGMRTAQALRDLGYGGVVRILAAEPHRPYDRPPLSKDFLRPDFPDGGLELVTPNYFVDNQIELLSGECAVALDLEARQVHTASGRTFDYGAFVVATGASARALPALSGSSAVMSLRTVDDARRLRAALDEQRRIVIVGGGFIGLEVAATARAAGCPVTVVEALSAPLVGVLGPELGRWLQQEHVDHGVDFRCSVTAASTVRASNGERLSLSDGSDLTADLIVVGVGVERDLAWLAAAGLEIHAGLVCDESGRTSASGVFGAGDIGCRHVAGNCTQVQHWTAAAESARRAAQAVLSIDAPPTPEDGYFWSDQYGLRIQFAGCAEPLAEVDVLSGSLAGGAFTAQYRLDGRVVGVLGVNSPRDFMRLRMALRTADKAAKAGAM
jgi:3-phenylpropionate/trans-cinnamate dioxygenase ferredoxin reductase subunit